jgi:hypothetical protein
MKRILSLFTTAWLCVEAFSKLFLVLLLVGLGGVALAQTAIPSPILAFDFPAWGKSAATFALFLATAVALIKGRIPNLAGWGVLLLSLALGEVGAFLLFTAGFLTDPAYLQFSPPWIWLAFGFSAWVIASGGYALLFQVVVALFHIRRSMTPVPSITAKTLAAAPLQVGDHLILPIGTPGTEPLIHNGVQIGSVLPLTPGQPVQTATTPLR